MNGREDFAARTELLPVHTLTLTDQQFLTGDNNGKPTAIVGQLRIVQYFSLAVRPLQSHTW